MEQLAVLDRWGYEYYYVTNIPLSSFLGWDATFNVSDVTPQVVVYELEVKYSDRRVEYIDGDLTILR